MCVSSYKINKLLKDFGYFSTEHFHNFILIHNVSSRTHKHICKNCIYAKLCAFYLQDAGLSLHRHNRYPAVG